jgi:hypothetical protein
MRVPYGVVPPNKIGAVVLAAVLAPVVLKKAKPVAKAVGNALIKAGETVRDFARENGIPEGTAAAAEKPKADVNPANDRTRKQAAQEPGPDVEGTPDPETIVDSASPYGQAEVEQHLAADVKGDTETPKPKKPSAKKRQARKVPEPDQPLNPKRGKNSRPS